MISASGWVWVRDAAASRLRMFATIVFMAVAPMCDRHFDTRRLFQGDVEGKGYGFVGRKPSDQVSRVAAPAMKRSKSVDFTGYWQRHIADWNGNWGRPNVPSHTRYKFQNHRVPGLLVLMEYRGKTYKLVQGIEPDSWKWTVQLDEKTVKSGEAPSREAAKKQRDLAGG
jgi:hypothetical protein